jgi:hypothetical protein
MVPGCQTDALGELLHTCRARETFHDDQVLVDRMIFLRVNKVWSKFSLASHLWNLGSEMFTRSLPAGAHILLQDTKLCDQPRQTLCSKKGSYLIRK